MPAGPSPDDIMGAIAESGYLMEQEVASQLERRGLFVRTNVAFEDPDEGKSREIDVTAIRRFACDETAKVAGYVELLVECKNSANPFVFIARPKNEADHRKAPEEFLFPYAYQMHTDIEQGRGSYRDISAFHHLGFDQVFTTHTSPWKAVQFCRIDRKGNGWHANNGGLYDAIFYPMAKAVMARKRDVPRASRPDEWRYFWLFFPIVVTSGELFLIDSSADDPAPLPVDRVSFQRELKSGKLSGTFMVTFVRQRALDAFVEQVVDPLAAHAIALMEDRLAFLKETRIPWID